MATATEERRAVLLRADDNVAVATRPIPAGFALELGDTVIAVREPIALGHKVAVHAIEPGAAVRKYGQIIGFASGPIEAATSATLTGRSNDRTEPSGSVISGMAIGGKMRRTRK